MGEYRRGFIDGHKEAEKEEIKFLKKVIGYLNMCLNDRIKQLEKEMK